MLENTDYNVTEFAVPKQPFVAAESPVKLKAKGKIVKEWKMEGHNAGTPTLHPITKDQPVTELELVPYGSARLRIGEFPLISATSG